MKYLILTLIFFFTLEARSEIKTSSEEEPLILIYSPQGKTYRKTAKNNTFEFKHSSAYAKHRETQEKRLRDQATFEKCSFSVAPVVDQRLNRSTLGSTNKKAIYIGDIKAWAADAVNDIFTEEIETRESAQVKIRLEPVLTKLYTYSENMNIYGVIAVNVHYRVDGVVKLHKYFRGLGADVNGDDSEDEYVDAINKSIVDGFTQIYEDFENVCNQFLSE